MRAAAPTSLGDYESLAGIEDRAAFWRPFTPLAQISTQHYIDSGIAAADRIIKQRVVAGDLTLLCDLKLDREQRAKRMRAVERASQ